MKSAFDELTAMVAKISESRKSAFNKWSEVKPAEFRFKEPPVSNFTNWAVCCDEPPYLRKIIATTPPGYTGENSIEAAPKVTDMLTAAQGWADSIENTTIATSFQPNTYSFAFTSAGAPTVKLNSDGSVEYTGTLPEAAKTFWTGVEKYAKTEMSELKAEIEKGQNVRTNLRKILGVEENESLTDRATELVATVANLAKERDILSEEIQTLRDRLEFWTQDWSERDCTEEEILANDLTFAPMMGVRMGK